MKISIKQIRNLIKSKDAINPYGRLRYKSSSYLVWPLRLFTESRPSDWSEDDEYDAAYTIYKRFGRSYINGFNLGFDGYDKTFALQGVKEHLLEKALAGYNDGRRILRLTKGV